MERILNADWSFYIGHMEIVSEENGKKYTVLAGYVSSYAGLYIRLYDEYMSFIAGDWIEYLHLRDWYKSEDSRIPESAIWQCVGAAELLEKLKIFS